MASLQLLITNLEEQRSRIDSALQALKSLQTEAQLDRDRVLQLAIDLVSLDESDPSTAVPDSLTEVPDSYYDQQSQVVQSFKGGINLLLSAAFSPAIVDQEIRAFLTLLPAPYLNSTLKLKDQRPAIAAFRGALLSSPLQQRQSSFSQLFLRERSNILLVNFSQLAQANIKITAGSASLPLSQLYRDFFKAGRGREFIAALYRVLDVCCSGRDRALLLIAVNLLWPLLSQPPQLRRVYS